METYVTPITLLIADDEVPVLDTLAAIFARERDIEIVAMAHDAAGAIELAILQPPDVAIVDVRMPGGGATAAARIIEGSPRTHVLALSAESEPGTVRDMIAMGALGYVVKTDPTSTIVDAVHRCARAASAISPSVAGPLAEGFTLDLHGATRSIHERASRIRRVLQSHAFSVVFQPIVDLATRRTVGAEALARFPEGAPDGWFADATDSGFLEDLELAALDLATETSPRGFPGYIAVNVSPGTLSSDRLAERFTGFGRRATVVEITEHAAIHDYGALAATLARLRADGVRFAVDDAGSGFASLHHIVSLEPDIVKIDMSLIRGVDRDVTRRAAVAALVGFASGIGATTVAEGIETPEETVVLEDLGVDNGQGFYLGRPMTAEDLISREAAVG